jgi:hypothetical protein
MRFQEFNKAKLGSLKESPSKWSRENKKNLVKEDSTADIKVTGINFKKGIYTIIFNGKRLVIHIHGMERVIGPYTIDSSEMEIYYKGEPLELDDDDWESMAEVITQYLNTHYKRSNQLIAWKQQLDDIDFNESEDLESIVDDIIDFNDFDAKNSLEDIKTLASAIKGTKKQQKFLDIAQARQQVIPVNVPRSQAQIVQPTQAQIQPKNAPIEIHMYLAFNYSREGNKEMLPGMNLPNVNQQNINDVFNKVKFKFDNIEDEIIAIAGEYGFGNPENAAGFGGRDLFWDLKIPVDKTVDWAKKIFQAKKAITEYTKSLNDSMAKIGLPGIDSLTWQGLFSEKLTKQQEEYFGTDQGFAALASGKIDLLKMIQDNMASGHQRET